MSDWSVDHRVPRGYIIDQKDVFDLSVDQITELVPSDHQMTLSCCCWWRTSESPRWTQNLQASQCPGHHPEAFKTLLIQTVWCISTNNHQTPPYSSSKSRQETSGKSWNLRCSSIKSGGPLWALHSTQPWPFFSLQAWLQNGALPHFPFSDKAACCMWSSWIILTLLLVWSLSWGQFDPDITSGWWDSVEEHSDSQFMTFSLCIKISCIKLTFSTEQMYNEHRWGLLTMGSKVVGFVWRT